MFICSCCGASGGWEDSRVVEGPLHRITRIDHGAVLGRSSFGCGYGLTAANIEAALTVGGPDQSLKNGDRRLLIVHRNQELGAFHGAVYIGGGDLEGTRPMTEDMEHALEQLEHRDTLFGKAESEDRVLVDP